MGDSPVDVSMLHLEALTKVPSYNNYLLVPLCQKSPSSLTEPSLKEWAIDIIEKDSKIINLCDKVIHTPTL